VEIQPQRPTTAERMELSMNADADLFRRERGLGDSGGMLSTFK